MNWYTKSKSSISQPSALDAKQLRRKEIRSQSISHNIKTEGNLPEVNLSSPLDLSNPQDSGGMVLLKSKKRDFVVSY